MIETVYCRRCRKRHKVHEGTRKLGVMTRMRWWFVDCPKRDFYLTPMRHETTGRWMPC